MRYSRNIFATWLFVAAGIFTLQSCLEPCDPPEVEAINALYFELSRAGESGFSEEEINNMYIARFYPAVDTIISDTVFLGNNYPLGPGKFYVNNNFPFENKNAPYYPFFRYEIFTADLTTIHVVDSIELQGSYVDDCNYENTSKKFLLNGNLVDQTGSESFVTLFKQ